MRIRNLGEKALIEVEIIGVEKLKNGTLVYKVGVPDYYVSWSDSNLERRSNPDIVSLPEEELTDIIKQTY